MMQLKTAIESPLLDSLSIDGAMGILVPLSYPSRLSSCRDFWSYGYCWGECGRRCKYHIWSTTSEDIPIDEVKLTIIATGFEDPSDIEVSSRGAEDSKPQPSPHPHHHEHHMQQPPQHPHHPKPTGGIKRNFQSNFLNRTRITGGNYGNGGDDFLDTPTYLRKQMD